MFPYPSQPEGEQDRHESGEAFDCPEFTVQLGNQGWRVLGARVERPVVTKTKKQAVAQAVQFARAALAKEVKIHFQTEWGEAYLHITLDR